MALTEIAVRESPSFSRINVAETLTLFRMFPTLWQHPGVRTSSYPP